MRNRAIGSRLPTIAIILVPLWIVDVHLDQILVRTVVARSPASILVLHLSGLNTEVAASQPGPDLVGREPVRFCLLREVAVGRISGEIREMLPAYNDLASMIVSER